ncbi:MAG: sensor domain-containing diguanylate cyclase [Deltaproteobacteria bacterium]|nr:sensor domain-containing diguanylate cyclase [Deltaproteobacteria bacterium]
MKINTASTETIERVLSRKILKYFRSPVQVDISDMLKSILKWANEFVPSEAGSILLDDPVLEATARKSGELYFVACFGRGSASIAGSTLDIKKGIAGKCYRMGKSYMSKEVGKDDAFYKYFDSKTLYNSKSIICVPIKIKNTTIGVLELINRAGDISYDTKDLELLNVFAGYTSTLIQNSLDAKKFAELSIRDSLTGLYNDRYFFDRITKELEIAKKKDKDLGLVFLDLDYFKEINDTYGHLVGSHLLSEVGSVIATCVQGFKCIPVRYGGDEFTIILPGAGLKKTERYAETIRKKIEDFIFIERNVPGVTKALKIKGHITASIGVASLKSNVKKGVSIQKMREALISSADTAMYVSKRKGKNTVTMAPLLRGRSTP